MTHLERVKAMYDMILSGRLLDAFETYYDDEVTMVEATGVVREGKDANRVWEEQWMSGVQEFHDGGTRAVTANEGEGKTAVESWMDITFKDGKRVTMEEVAIQTWIDGKIVHERFYYDTSGMQQ